MATRKRLSKHFVVEEFDCRDGTKVPPRLYDGLVRLARLYLEPLHARYGSVHINSGYRTRSHNARIGGAKNSFHIYDLHGDFEQACDFTCARGTPRDWWKTVNAIRQNKRGGKGGLGLYSSFVHVDLRDYKSDWRG